MLHIFSYLEWHDLKRVKGTCHWFKELASNSPIWERHFHKFFSNDPAFKHLKDSEEEGGDRKKRKIEMDWEGLFVIYCRDRIALCCDEKEGIYFATEQYCKSVHPLEAAIYLGPFSDPDIARKMRLLFLNGSNLRAVSPMYIRDIFLPSFKGTPSEHLPTFESFLYPDHCHFMNLSITICKNLHIKYEFAPVSERSEKSHKLIMKSIRKLVDQEKMMREATCKFKETFNSI